MAGHNRTRSGKVPFLYRISLFLSHSAASFVIRFPIDAGVFFVKGKVRESSTICARFVRQACRLP